MFTNADRKSYKIFFGCFTDVVLPFMMYSIIVGFCVVSLWVNDRPVQLNGISIQTADFKKLAIGAEGEFAKTFRPRSIVKSNPPLEGQALYKSYISEIVKTKYPDLDSNLIAAIVYHESRFQPDAVNKKTNATGLMQILPKWHTDRARKLGVTDLSDPYGNVLVGCDILNELYQQKHSMDYTLDFYAGGYGYADRYKNSISPYRKELNEILQEHILGKE